jgi:hypothetical protein
MAPPTLRAILSTMFTRRPDQVASDLAWLRHRLKMFIALLEEDINGSSDNDMLVEDLWAILRGTDE